MNSSPWLTRSACHFCCRWLLQEWMAFSSILALAGVDRNLCWFEAQLLGLSTTNAPAAETSVPVASHYFWAMHVRDVGHLQVHDCHVLSHFCFGLTCVPEISRICEQAGRLVGLIISVYHTCTLLQTITHSYYVCWNMFDLELWIRNIYIYTHNHNITN
jgi:hypothetical protein